jgi:hypothetical protein
MPQMPVLRELATETNSQMRRGKPILELKELEPDWERYNAWRASLVESYSQWLKRRHKLGLDSTDQERLET